jgi:threonine aldolase
MAQRLASGLKSAGLTITQRVEANAVFAVMSPELIERLQHDFRFYEWNEARHEVRLMCSWATDADDVDALVGAV